MISILPNNLSREPLEHQFEIDYKTLKRALVETAKTMNMSIEVVEDTYYVSNGGFLSGLGSKTIPCVAFYHTDHKKDYYSIVLELKEAYGTHYLYIHRGGTSRNQINRNMGGFYTQFGTDGKISQHRPGLLGKMIGNAAESKLQDEELYYDAAYKLVGSAIVKAELMMVESPKKTVTQAAAPRKDYSAQKSAPAANFESRPQKETVKPAAASYEEPSKSVPSQTLRQSIGIETVGGVFTKIIPVGTPLPTEKSMTFSTAADRQTSVEVHVLQGESEKASENKSLGKYMLDGITIAARGVPQIEVTFRVNDYGELELAAKDATANKELNIIVDNLLENRQKVQEKAPKKVSSAVCPLHVSDSDEEYLKWLDSEVGLSTASGTYFKAFEKETYIPARNVLNLSVAADEQMDFDLQVIEKSGPSPKDIHAIGKFILDDLPYSTEGKLLIELDLQIDTKGDMVVTAKTLAKDKYLPIIFVPYPQNVQQKPEPENQQAESFSQTQSEPSQPAIKQTETKAKSKVEQLKELADLLDRGVVTQEEFEIIKKSIIYK